MGVGWYVAREREMPGQSGVLPHGGRALTFAQHHLDELARELQLPLLKSFFSSDPSALAAYLREHGVDADADEFETEEWFDPAEILPTVQALIERLHDPPIGMGQPDKVRDDLAAMADILAAAIEQGVRVHIATGLAEDLGPPHH
jgi:glycine/D-amino acid oxidase-like deaminating enzyme